MTIIIIEEVPRSLVYHLVSSLHTAMAKSVAAGVKAVWEAAKKDFKENSHTNLLKQDVIDVLDLAKRKVARVKRESPSSQPKTSAVSGKVGPLVNQDVGAELLTHFKSEWADIHQSTQEASKVASMMDADLGQLSQSITRSHAIINRCRDEFSCLKEVVETLDEAHGKVEAINGLIRQIEQDILNYSQAKAELVVERQKHSLQRQHEHEIMENRTKVEHVRKVLLNEQKLSLNIKHEVETKGLKERQLAFQELFDKQMADYRTHGEVDRPIEGIRDRSSSHLEEVVIEDEDGTASLHEFLSDVLDDSPAEAVKDTPTEPEKDTPTVSQESEQPLPEDEDTPQPGLESKSVI